MVVVIEGGDAAGKKTQSEKLAERLNATRFPFPNYDSPTGELILGHLKKLWACKCIPRPGEERDVRDALEEEHIDPMVFQSLQAVNRLESLPDIQKARSRGPVVFDRYWQSACVYGALDGLDREWLLRVQGWPMPAADVNILLDVPVEVGFERRPERRDRYEINREFLGRVREEYLVLWNAPGEREWNYPSQYQFIEQRAGWYVVNGLGTVDEVHERIMTIVYRYQ